MYLKFVLLTVYADYGCRFIGSQSWYCAKTSHQFSVVLWLGKEVMRDLFLGVSHHPHAAFTGQFVEGTTGQLVSDVFVIEEDLEIIKSIRKMKLNFWK